jgi:hypothetical protein
LRSCSFRVEDEIHPATNNGLVLINGPGATLYVWDDESKRYDQIDRLTKCVVRDGPQGRKIISGISDHLVNDVQLTPDAAGIVVEVTPAAPCKGCK